MGREALACPAMSKPSTSVARSAATVWSALTIALSGCASADHIVIKSSSQSSIEQAEVYEQRARDMQKVGAGPQTTELRRLADKQRLDAKNSEAKGFTEGAFDLLFNSLFESWLASPPKGKQK
jgi:hypothetical protein